MHAAQFIHGSFMITFSGGPHLLLLYFAIHAVAFLIRDFGILRLDRLFLFLGERLIGNDRLRVAAAEEVCSEDDKGDDELSNSHWSKVGGCYGESEREGIGGHSSPYVNSHVSIQRRRRFTVINHTGPHPRDCVHVERSEADRAVAKHGVQSAGMGGAEVTTPRVVGWIAGLADDYCSLVLITQRRKVPAKDALIPAGIVPAFVIAAVQT